MLSIHARTVWPQCALAFALSAAPVATAGAAPVQSCSAPSPDIDYYGTANCVPAASCVPGFPPALGNNRCLDFRIPGTPSLHPTTILFVHGGGWSSGRKENNPQFLDHLCSLGYHVVSCNYTLACNDPNTPQYEQPSFPRAVVDVRTAIGWIRDVSGGQSYGLPQCVVLVGSSAGAHLAAMAGAIGDLAAPSQVTPTLYLASSLAVSLTITFSADFDPYRRGHETVSCATCSTGPFEPHAAKFANDHGGMTESFIGCEWWNTLAYTPIPAPVPFDYAALPSQNWTTDPFLNASPTHWLHPLSSPFYVLHSNCDNFFPTVETKWFEQAAALRSVTFEKKIVPGGHGIMMMLSERDAANAVDSIIQGFGGYVHCP